MPSVFLESLLKNIKFEWKFAFFSAVTIGFLTHVYVFLNRLPNNDGVFNIYNTQAKVASGRFFLGPASGMSTFFDLPWVIGMLSIIFLGLAAVCIVILFEVRKKISIILVSGIMVVFPSVSATFSYLFTADGYMLGIFFAILAVVCTKHFKYGFLIGAILLCLSVGIYQANLSVTLTFATLWIIHAILRFDISLKNIFSYILRSGLMVTLGMALYLVVYKIFTQYLSVSITSYQGLDKVGMLTIEDIPKRFEDIKYELQTFFFDGIFNHTPINLLEVLNILIFIIMILSLFTMIIKKQLYKKIGHLFILIVLISSLPLSYYIVFFISPVATYHMLMVFSLSSVYIFLVLMYDATDELKAMFMERMNTWATVIVIAVTIVNFSLIANISYFNMELRYEKTMSLANRILDRIEQLDDYEQIENIAVIGKAQLTSTLNGEIIPNKIPSMIGTKGEVFVAHSYHYSALFDHFFGYPLKSANEKEIEKIQNSKEYKAMDVWPKQNAIMVFGNTVVVKFEDK